MHYLLENKIVKPFIKHILYLLFLIISFPIFSQTKEISGSIISISNKDALSGVTIKLLSKDSTEIINTLTDQKGVFIFKNIKDSSSYLLKSSLIGYKTLYTPINFEKYKSSEKVLIELESQEIEIDEITISASVPLTLKGDTMEFDAKNFVTREFADADEVVAQIPGIMIDEEGNVKAHGENVTKVIVDGKEFFSSDPRIALKNLPADIISKIQIIDEKSTHARFSGFDDGKRNKVINIVTKPDKRKGQFGKMNAAKGNGNKFASDLVINKFNKDQKYAVNLMANNVNETNFAEQGRGGTRRGNNNTDRGLSNTYAGAITYANTYLSDKMDVSGDYNFRHLKTETKANSLIQYLNTSQNNQRRNQNQFSDLTNNEHKFNATVKWNIDSIQKLELTPNVVYTFTNRLQNTDFQTKRDSTSLINKSDRFSENSTSNLRYSGALSYMIRLNKKGRTLSLSASSNKNTNDADGLNLAITEYYRNALLNRIDTNNNASVTNGYGSGMNTKISLSEKINATNSLQINYNFRNTASYSNRETFEYLTETGQLGELKERLSNEFRNDYNYHNAGLSYVYNIKDTLRVQFGMQYQHGIRNNNRIVPYDINTTANFGSFLPDIAVKLNLSKTKTLEVNYNTQTNTPSINQLQDFINNQNELRITNGNPTLDQEYAHTIRLQYKDINKATGRSLTTNVSLEFINDKIINNILMPDTSIILFDDIKLGAGGQYIIPVNTNGAYSTRVNNSYALPIERIKVNFNFNTMVGFSNDLSRINDEDLINKTFAFSQSIGLNSKFSKKYIFGLTYNIDGRFTSNNIINRTNYNVLNHRLNTRITVEPTKHLSLRTNYILMNNSGILGSPNIKTAIWNATIGYKMLKGNNGEIAIKGYDLLNNAKNINRNITENSVSEVLSNTLARYYLLVFTYNLRQFGGKKAK